MKARQRGKLGVIWLCILLMFGSFIILLDLEDNIEAKPVINNGVQYSPYSPIRINSDSDFNAAHGVTGGSGIPGDPWIIDDWDIYGLGSSACIYIGNTTGHFLIQDCYLHHANWNVITGQYWQNSGIFLYNVENGTVNNNTISDNNLAGIVVSNSNYVNVTNNTLNNNPSSAIRLTVSRDTILMNNIMTEAGLTIDGYPEQYWSDHIIDTTNTVDGRPVQYWRGVVGGVVPAGAGQVILAGCNGVTVQDQIISNLSKGITVGFSVNCIITNNHISNTGRGIDIYRGSGNSMIDNDCTNNCDGIFIGTSPDSIIKSNYLCNNSNDGIFFSGLSNGLIESNTISSNQRYGISVFSVTGTTIINNTIDSNENVGLYLSGCTNLNIDNNSMIFNGLYLTGADQNKWNTHTILDTNTVNGKPVYYVKNQSPVVAPAGRGQIIIANCSEITVSDQNLSNGSAGILVGFSSNMTITNVESSGNRQGLFGSDINNVFISGSRFNYNQREAVYFSQGANISIVSTNCSFNGISGITTQNTDNVTITDVNASFNMDDGFCLYGHNYSITNCNVNMNDGMGILISGSNYSTISDNILANNAYGLMVLHFENGTISNNTASANTGCGLWIVHDSFYNTVTNNICFNNQIGLQLQESFYNDIYHNDFIYNMRQGEDLETNNWDNGYPSGGNYWSDYPGFDNNSGPNQDIPGSDGIGDIQRNIDWGSNIDRYPLMTASVDLEYPDSTVSNIDPYWCNSQIDIEAVAEDKQNNVANVSLYHRFSSDNGTTGIWPNYSWSNWTIFDKDENAPWSWPFDFPEGEVFYEFYSVAIDVLNNNENLSYSGYDPSPDESAAYDNTLPIISLVSPLNNSVIRPAIDIDLNITDENLKVVNYSLYGNTGVNLYDPYVIDTASWNDGDHQLTVRALDKAENLIVRLYGISIDGNGPSITSTTPSDNSDEIPLNTTIAVLFNEPMNTTSVENSLQFSPLIGTAVYEWNLDNTLLTIIPSSNLSLNTTYTLSILIDAKDVAGNPMASAFTWSFTTWSDADNDEIPDIKEDTDGDGINDLEDTDDDNDGFLDEWEIFLGTDPQDAASVPLDTDDDGIPDGDENNTKAWMDTDDDNDGIPDDEEDDPLNPHSPGINAYLWMIVILVIVGIVGGILMFTRMRSRPPPEPQPVPESQPRPESAEPEPKKQPLSKSELRERVEKAYREGRMSEDQYLKNMERFKD